MNGFSNLIDNIAEKAQKNRKLGEYRDEQGEWRCSVCHAKTRCKINLPGIGFREVVQICDCIKKEQAEQAERNRLAEIDRKKSICFRDAAMKGWTFENDDKSDLKLTAAATNFAENFKTFYTDGKGLLLFGSVGTGKSYAAACIANRIIENGYSAKMTNFAPIINDLQDINRDKNEYIRDLIHCSLLIIDDLGAERRSPFAQEIVFNVIDAGYTAKLPMIITTNLTGSELKNPDNVQAGRIYDRILHRCFPLEVNGRSRRKQDLKNSYDETRELLGI